MRSCVCLEVTFAQAIENGEVKSLRYLLCVVCFLMCEANSIKELDVVWNYLLSEEWLLSAKSLDF